MEEMIPCAVKDQEVFQRVWQRVMAGQDQARSPIETVPANMQGDLSCECLEALAGRQDGSIPAECLRQEEGTQPGGEQPEQPPAEGCPPAEQPAPELPGEEPPAEGCPPAEQPAPELPGEEPPAEGCPSEEPPAPVQQEGLPAEDGPARGSDLPRLWEEPQETQDRTARLRQQVMEALEGWQFYRHLARRARGADARVLNSMAGEQHRHARKLSAAYFLLTGLRYWPSELLTVPAIPSYWGALRTRHQAEQRQETAFRMAADDWDDPELLALYAELIEACQRRCRQLRSLLEQDNP